MKKFLLLCLIVCFNLYSQREEVQIIVPVEDNFELEVKTIISIDSLDTTRFIFKYTLISSPSSGQPVRLFEISPPFGKDGDTSIAPNHWSTLGTPRRSSWNSNGERYDLLPGDTLSGFVFIIKELPDISYWYAEGSDTIYFPEIRGGPPYISEKKWVRDSLNKIYFRKTPFGPGKYGYTVGPGPLPPGWWKRWSWGDSTYFVSDSGFYHLIERLNKCFELNWLKQRARDHLLRIYERALVNYRTHGIEHAQRVLNQAISYLKRERGKLIFDEGFYILYYRTIFVRDHLWGRGEKK
ncbi:MAG: hypothetical protein ABIN20_03335 [candidate division WOR-3 bacterium]